MAGSANLRPSVAARQAVQRRLHHRWQTLGRDGKARRETPHNDRPARPPTTDHRRDPRSNEVEAPLVEASPGAIPKNETLSWVVCPA